MLVKSIFSLSVATSAVLQSAYATPNIVDHLRLPLEKVLSVTSHCSDVHVDVEVPTKEQILSLAKNLTETYTIMITDLWDLQDFPDELEEMTAVRPNLVSSAVTNHPSLSTDKCITRGLRQILRISKPP